MYLIYIYPLHICIRDLLCVCVCVCVCVCIRALGFCGRCADYICIYIYIHILHIYMSQIYIHELAMRKASEESKKKKL